MFARYSSMAAGRSGGSKWNICDGDGDGESPRKCELIEWERQAEAARRVYAPLASGEI